MGGGVRQKGPSRCRHHPVPSVGPRLRMESLAMSPTASLMASAGTPHPHSPLALAQTPLDKPTCCRSPGVSVGEMPAGLLASMLFLVSARGCSMLRLGRDAYRWLPCRLMVGATARSMGLRLRSRGSFRQSPLAVLFLKKRSQHSEGAAWHLVNGEGLQPDVPSTSQGLFHLLLYLAVGKYCSSITLIF